MIASCFSVDSEQVILHSPHQRHEHQAEMRNLTINKPIKALGLTAAKVQLHPEVSASITLNIARSEDEATRPRKRWHGRTHRQTDTQIDQTKTLYGLTQLALPPKVGPTSTGL